jgi:ribonuclease VapC
MSAKVLDSYALLAFLEDEPGADLVRGLLAKAEDRGAKLLLSVVSLGEVWASIARSSSPQDADHYIEEIQGMSVDIVDADWSMTRQAASLRASLGLPYAACFAIALAKARRAELISGNREIAEADTGITVTWKSNADR